MTMSGCDYELVIPSNHAGPIIKELVTLADLAMYK